jgi:hypothetical protein
MVDEKIVFHQVPISLAKASPLGTQPNIPSQFSIFSSFLNQIEPFFCVIGQRKLEVYKCSLSIRSKGAMQKTQGRG